MSDVVKLVVGGVAYTGWKSVSITRSLDEPVHQFELEVFDQWAGGRVGVPVGAPFKLYLDNSLITTGYIDKIKRHYDAKARSVTVGGRSKAADLIDCAFPVGEQPSSWDGLTALAICQALAKPFGIQVSDASGLASHVINSVNLRAGDKPMELMQLYMRNIGARIISLPDGNLQIVSVSQHKLVTPLVLGQNILDCDDEQNLQDRFSEYRCLSQPKSGQGGLPLDELETTSIDAMMHGLRYRPTVIVPHQMLNTQVEVDAAARVARNVAAGHSHTTTYTVRGWRHAGGVWEPNRQVRVRDPECGWNTWLMVGSVTLTSDDKSGVLAHLRVLPVTAYDIMAEPEKDESSTGEL